MRYALLTSLFLGAVVSLGCAQSELAHTTGTSDKGDQNLRDCADGFATCNRSLLTEFQANEIDELHENLCSHFRLYQSAGTLGLGTSVAT